MIAVGAQITEVDCETRGTQSLPSSCTFILGTRSDDLIVQLQESDAIQAGTTIQLEVQGVRAPPSLSPVSGF